MAKVPRAVLKEYFQSGDMPTQAQFGLTLDSMVNFVDDRSFIGLREYDPALDYLVGDCAVFNNQVVKCTTATTGVFDPADWIILAAFGSVSYAGTWDTQANNPVLQSSVGTEGFYYVVTNASPDPNDNTTLNGINDWGIGDWAIFNGTVWEKVDNSESPIVASGVSFAPAGPITSTNVQDAVEEVFSILDSDKADKIIPAVSGNFAALDAGGNLADSNFGPSDYLDKNNAIVYTPTGNYNPATKLYVDQGLTTKLDLTGGTISGSMVITGDLTLGGDPTALLEAATKQYVDTNDATKLNLSGGTLSGPLILNANPGTALGAATRQYVDSAVGAIPAQVKTVAIPYTFAGAVQGFTNAAFVRFPTAATQIRLTVPPVNTLFPGTTAISVRMVVDYMTTTATATGNIALYDFTTFAAIAPFSGSSQPLAATSGVWTVLTTASFTLSAARTFEIIVQRTSSAGTVFVEGVTLLVTYT